MGWDFGKIGDTFNQTFNPFSDDWDWKRSLAAVGTMGWSVATEAAVEATGEVLSGSFEELGRGIGNVARDVEAGWNLGFNGGLTGGSRTQAQTPAQQEATRELYDPRRRRGNQMQNFSSLTSGQFDSQPSLIG